MKQEIKRLWVAALRSGKYKQGRKQLRTKEGLYCCLGVLCDIAANYGIGKWIDIHENPSFISENENTNGVLPAAVQKWAGLEARGPACFFYDHNKPSSLIDQNDTGTSFVEIANLIEKNFRCPHT